jgi:hypothetical protein
MRNVFLGKRTNSVEKSAITLPFHGKLFGGRSNSSRRRGEGLD